MKKIIFIIAVLILSSCTNTENLDNQTVSVEVAQSCVENEGTWLAAFSQCENTGEDWCDASGGEFNECGSACRNDPLAEMCTAQCVPYCSFGKIEKVEVDDNWNVLSEEEAEELVVNMIGDCSKNECDNFEVNIVIGEDGISKVESIHDGLKDDSLRAIKRVYMIDYVDFKWVLGDEVSKEFKCQKGRGHEDFGTDFCL